MALEVSYTLAGAGTAAVNGDYSDTGGHEGTRYFKRAGVSYYIFWNVEYSHWLVGTVLGDYFEAQYGVEGAIDFIPLAGWQIWGGDTPGVAPPPTVTVTGGGGSARRGLVLGFV